MKYTASQERAVDSLMIDWQDWGLNNDSGEVDPMPYLARNRGWFPLEPGQHMSVTIGQRRYQVARLEDLSADD